MSFFGERYSAAMRAESAQSLAQRARVAALMTTAQQPDDELGTPVAVDPVRLLHDAHVLVAVSSMVAFSTGFTLVASVVMREVDTSGHGPFFAAPRRSEGGIEFGVQYADGRRGDTFGPLDVAADADTARRVIVVPHGGFGRPNRFDQHVWVHPLPPIGPLTFVVRWAARGFDERRHEIDAQPIIEAAARSAPFWPRTPPAADDATHGDLEAAVLGLLTNRVGNIHGARIRGMLLEGHHPETTLLIAFDRVTAAGSEYRELRGALWHDDTSTPSLTHDSPVEVADLFVRRLRAAAES
jgi:hypothetical protein